MANNKKISQQLLTLKRKLKWQSDAIKNIQKNVGNTNTSKYQDLRQDVLSDRRQSINFWAGIFLFVFSVVSVVMYVKNYELQKEAEIALEKTKEMQKEAEIASEETKELRQETKIALEKTKEIQKEAEIIIEEMRDSKKNAEELVTSLVKDPEQKLTKEIKRGVEKFGTKLDKLMFVAQQQKDYKKAIALWQDIITTANHENDKKYISIGYFNLGHSYSELKEYQKAIDAYKKVIKIDPNDYKAHNNMGDAYLKLKEYQEAIGAYKEVIKITSDFSAVFAPKLVEIEPIDYKPIKPISDDYYADLFATGNVSMTAYIDYSMVFGDYDNFKTYDNMGYAYGELKEYQKAIDAYKAAIKIKPDKHETYYNMGNAYRKLKKYQKAIDAYKKVIKIDPDDYKAHNNMGDAYLKLKEYQEAIGAYKEVIKITSDFSAVLFRKLVEIKPDDYEAILAIDNSSMILDIDYSIIFGDYDNFKTYDNMGYAYGELKEYQKAIGAYKEAIKIKPDKHETYYNMGNAYRKLKKYQKAIDAYKEAIKIKPDYDKAKRSLKQLEVFVLTL